MMMTVIPAMSFEDWRALGAMGGSASAAQRIFDGSRRDDDQYPGSDPRPEIVREPQAHLIVLSRHPLANPARERSFTPHEAGLALAAHYRRTLLGRGTAAVSLLTALAKAGNELLEEAARIRFGGGRAEGASAAVSRRDRELAEKALSMADLEAEATDASAGRLSQCTVVAETAEEASVIRAAIEWALTICPPATRFEGQKLIVRPEALPSAEEIVAAMEKIRPNPFQARPDNRKHVALIASSGAEEALVATVKTLPRDMAVAPGRSRALWSLLIENDRHWRLKIDLPPSKGPGAVYRDHEALIGATDQAIIAWNGDDSDPALAAIAYAARRGKLMLAIDANGEAYDLDLVSAHAMALHLSAAERARSRSASAFDVAAASPEGRLGLSLVRGLGREALERLSAVPGASLTELVAMAREDNGRRTLVLEHKVPGAALQLLADDKIVADARESLLRILGHCRSHNVTVIGPESYPQALLASGKIPPVLFVEAKDPSAFASFGRGAALLGDERMLSGIAAMAKDLAERVCRLGVSLIQVEGASAIAPEGPSVLVLASGHGHYGADPASTKAFRARIVAAGGFVVSALPPVESGSAWSPEKRDRVGIPSSRNDRTKAAAIDLAVRIGAMTVLTQVGDRSPATRTVATATELGRPIVALMPPKELRHLPEVGGNVAMIGVAGAELPAWLGISGNAGLLIAKTYGEKRAARSSGADMRLAAERIAQAIAA